MKLSFTEKAKTQCRISIYAILSCAISWICLGVYNFGFAPHGNTGIAFATADAPSLITIAYADPLPPDDTAIAPQAQEGYSSIVAIGGNAIEITDSYDSYEAPLVGAGIWKGSLSTTDGSWAYLIGHNPGSFSCIVDLRCGDAIGIWDHAGAYRSYTVAEVFNIPSDTYWVELAPSVTGYGESAILQTCLEDSLYRIIIAV